MRSRVRQLAEYRVTAAQRAALRGAVGWGGLMALEWIVDVADEGGFYHVGTAYACADTRGVPASRSPTASSPRGRATCASTRAR